MKLKNYIQGRWTEPSGEGIPQYHAITGELIAVCGSEGIDFAEMMDYGRRVGGPPLRKMTFQERGLMLKSLALMLNEIKEKYYPVSYMTGAIRADSSFDIDGGDRKPVFLLEPAPEISRLHILRGWGRGDLGQRRHFHGSPYHDPETGHCHGTQRL